ncbi:MAG: exo-alpha-sialidase, partial [Burkholderiaceae bacterium]
ETLRNGLPQKDCYDLIYRHGLAISDDGKTLLMGSTTGGLWISENGGDAWQEISHTLPPIYAVRFC